MKLSSSITILMIFISISATSQCSMEILKIGRKLSKEVAFKTMKEISVNTGRNEDSTIKNCKYDELNGVIIFDVELTWSASTQMLFGEAGQCVVWGEIKISDEDFSEFKFVIKDMNTFSKRCVNSRKWDVLEAAVNGAMNSGGGY